MKLVAVDTIKLVPHPAMDFRLCLWKPSHFPTRLEIHSKETTWRTFVLDGCPCGVRIRKKDDMWICTVFAEEGKWTGRLHEKLVKRLRRAYGFDDDYGAFLCLCSRKKRLQHVLGPFMGMRSSCPENMFELCVLTVLLQNTTVTRSRDMLDAVLRLAGGSVEFDGVQLFHFCTPKSLRVLGMERLRGEARVGYRDKVLVSIADFFSAQPIEFDGHDANELMQLLCQIKGVGPYTAGVVASSIFHDQAAYGLDCWNRKIVKKALGIPDDLPDETLKKLLTRRYSPCEGLVVELLVESAYLRNPVAPVYPTDASAQAASWKWPRP